MCYHFTYEIQTICILLLCVFAMCNPGQSVRSDKVIVADPEGGPAPPPILKTKFCKDLKNLFDS